MAKIMPAGDPNLSRAAARRRLAFAGAAILAAAAALVYAMAPRHGNGPSAACPGSRERALALQPLAHGEMAALSVAPWPRPAPEIAFKSADGAPVTLASFKGKATLVNFWATWCVPCRREMPALDRLQGKAGAEDFAVVAVNVDTARLERPKAFLAEIGVKNLAFYADPSADALQVLKAEGLGLGLPTTLLIDREGCGLAVLAGAAEWDSADALAVVSAARK
ncbi:TlpA disulfide reductase family protein [Methylocella sp.]|uniref:thiol:disulfide interchange protein TlpA n=1 Tax=Methylocella sp. TaxID=1978226 RepID=UPI0035B2488C